MVLALLGAGLVLGASVGVLATLVLLCVKANKRETQAPLGLADAKTLPVTSTETQAPLGVAEANASPVVSTAPRSCTGSTAPPLCRAGVEKVRPKSRIFEAPSRETTGLYEQVER
jgi:hypothetical protein